MFRIVIKIVYKNSVLKAEKSGDIFKDLGTGSNNFIKNNIRNKKVQLFIIFKLL